MMTIKEFAGLCNCNTQTLRYYDRIDLLKPVKVDQWSGYRYYAESQAIDFVKIKNLQAADFSIEEIKHLLTKCDQEVYDAFSSKILQQEQKLARIREIQQSYLTEKINMEKMIKELCGYLVGQMDDTECLLEFGLRPEDAADIKKCIQDYMEAALGKGLPEAKKVTVVVDDKVFRGDDAPKFVFSLDEENLPDTLLIGEENIADDSGFNPENYDTLWECHGWNHVYEFIDSIPHLEPGTDYCFWFRLNQRTNRDNISFSLFMVGAMLLRGYGSDTKMSCAVDKSSDSKNHFALMRRR